MSIGTRLFLFLAYWSRKLPEFRGKYRIGNILRSYLVSKSDDNIADIQLSSGPIIKVSVVNDTDFEALWNGTYDTDLIGAFLRTFDDNWVVLDVGANIGFYTLPFSLDKRVHIHAFEPLSSNFQMLCESLKYNLSHNVTPHRFGLGSCEEQVDLVLTEKGSSGNAVVATDETSIDGLGCTESIQIYSLDSVYERYGIKACHFIKVDVEGYENSFVKGALGVISAYRPLIYGEFNSYFLNKRDESLKYTWEVLKNMSYRVFIQVRHGHELLPKFREVEIYEDGLENLLFVPEEYNESLIFHLID